MSANTTVFDASGALNATADMYSSAGVAGVAAIVFSSTVSILATLAMLAVMIPTLMHSPNEHRLRTTVVPITASLMLATVVQSVGSLMSVRWVIQGYVTDSTFCSLQGGIKNAGNVGIAVWSFIAAASAFDRLFLRNSTSRYGILILLCAGWLVVALVPLLGRFAIETKSRGPYFGVSGLWCWITDGYPVERTMMEYFIEFLSAGLSFILYTAVLLRVRGNLAQSKDGRWKLRWIASRDAWQLAISRDLIDSMMLKAAFYSVLFPVVYSILLIPIALARFTEFAGGRVPLWATVLADVIFNLTGLVDSVLILVLRRKLPELGALPDFGTKRSTLDLDGPLATAGITPFTLTESDVEKGAARMNLDLPVDGRSRSDSRFSVSTVDSAPRQPMSVW